MATNVKRIENEKKWCIVCPCEPEIENWPDSKEVAMLNGVCSSKYTDKTFKKIKIISPMGDNLK